MLINADRVTEHNALALEIVIIIDLYCWGMDIFNWFFYEIIDVGVFFKEIINVGLLTIAIRIIIRNSYNIR